MYWICCKIMDSFNFFNQFTEFVSLASVSTALKYYANKLYDNCVYNNVYFMFSLLLIYTACKFNYIISD